VSKAGEAIDQMKPTAEAWDFAPEDGETVGAWCSLGLITLAGTIAAGQEIRPAAAGLLALIAERAVAEAGIDNVVEHTEEVIRTAGTEMDKENQK
jgi:hypothetical protein